MKQKSYDILKYESNNIIQKIILNNYINEISLVIKKYNLKRIFDCGSGEGHMIIKIISQMPKVTFYSGDYSFEKVFTFKNKKIDSILHFVCDIYNNPIRHDIEFDAVLNLSVLEHLHNPDKAIDSLISINARYFIISVPNEPFFRITNLLRGKYLKNFGNHPEHIHLWSVRKFSEILEKFFEIKEKFYPFPWQVYVCKKK